MGQRTEGSKNMSQSAHEPCALNPLIPQEHYRVSLQLSLVHRKLKHGGDVMRRISARSCNFKILGFKKCAYYSMKCNQNGSSLQ